MKLNSNQEEAVNLINGAVLILAGAGSGKTRVLTERIANLISNYNVKPYNILSVTFTNKAAKEMKERISLRVGEEIAKSLWAGTFHSICSKILRSEIKHLDRSSNFVIYDTQDQQKLFKDCLKKLNIDEKNYSDSKISREISKAKSLGYSPEVYTQTFLSYKDQKIGEIYALYQDELKKNNALDFDDILFYCVKIFKEFPEVLLKYQQKFRYIMVDEYQDTNHIQYELIKALADNFKNICVVGDVDQSIYSFRNADFRIILNFQKDYQDAKIIKLEKNYRSTQNIVNLSNHIIKENRERFPKILDTDNEIGEKVKVFEARDEEEEVRFIIKELYKLVEKGYEYKDFTVLYRTNAQSRIFEEYFVRNNIPHQIIGGFKFFERKEIKDIISYLKVIFNQDDSIGLQRIINYPKRGIGSTTIEKLNKLSEELGITLWDALNLKTLENISAGTQKTIREFVYLINTLREKSTHYSISKLIKTILDDTNFISELQTEDEKKDKDNDRTENIYQLISSADDFEINSDDTSLESYLNYISLIADSDSIEEQNKKVKLMTVHTSKGLEFPVVFVAGLCEGIFPHVNSKTDQEVEEERRLMYVAITRAKKILYFSFPRIRNVFGSYQNYLPSRFLAECPSEYTSGYQISKEKHKKFNDDNLYLNKTREENRKKREDDGFINEDYVYNRKNSKQGDGFINEDYQYEKKPSKKIDSYEIQKKLESRYSTNKSTSTNKYNEGQRVRSDKWGDGIITKIMENPKKTILMVSFASVGGIKMIDPNVTTLEKI